MNSRELLERLIAHPTISRQSNLSLIHEVRAWLEASHIPVTIVESGDGVCANLYAKTGPQDIPGVLLSGHSDVVPVEGQAWSMPPFTLTGKDGRLYGRGTADMKGFLACAIRAMIEASKQNLAIPLELAISYDEEIGCIGVRRLIDVMRQAPVRPRMAIIGEPTELQAASGHKGKLAACAACHGREGHSALAPLALNAIHLASDLIQALRQLQARIAKTGCRDADYDIAYTTIHAGVIEGGKALNIVPNHCSLAFEIRHLAEDCPDAILRQIEDAAQDIVKRTGDPDARIEIEITNRYPGLLTAADSEVIRFVQSLTGANSTCKVAFGTEAGLFSQHLSIPCAICGPGSMAQGHKADEFIEISQLDRCDAMLGRLQDRLISGF